MLELPRMIQFALENHKCKYVVDVAH